MSEAKPAVKTQETQPTPANARRTKTLLIMTSILFALWVGAMIAMYVTTVYPERYPATKSAPASPR